MNRGCYNDLVLSEFESTFDTFDSLIIPPYNPLVRQVHNHIFGWARDSKHNIMIIIIFMYFYNFYYVNYEHRYRIKRLSSFLIFKGLGALPLPKISPPHPWLRLCATDFIGALLP